jgi:C-terminal processing protease CtpA/Prc
MILNTKKLAMLSLALFAFASCMLTGFAQRPADDQPDMKIDAATRTQVIETLVKNLNDSYVFPDVAKQMGEAVRGRLQKGEYDQMTGASAFAKALTEHLQAVSHDKHLRVRYSNEAIPAQSSNRREPSPEERQNMLRYYGTVNYGFEKIERMAGNIGYLDLRGFAVADMAGDTLAAAMNFVGNTEALIIDLRQNGGGDPAMVTLLCSYLFGQEPVHINDLYWREGNRTEEFWTKKSVPGKRYEGKDVYVLTSNRTFSGGEEFAYDMKNLKRATLVGETTGGGANPGGPVRLTEHFDVFIPAGRAISPITKTNWEGTGVKPDVEVPKELALKTAYLMALNKLAEKATDDRAKGEYKHLIEESRKELDQMKLQPKAGQ